jgi:hypothetical protein
MGALYTTLDRLEGQGLIKTATGPRRRNVVVVRSGWASDQPRWCDAVGADTAGCRGYLSQLDNQLGGFLGASDYTGAIALTDQNRNDRRLEASHVDC